MSRAFSRRSPRVGNLRKVSCKELCFLIVSGGALDRRRFTQILRLGIETSNAGVLQNFGQRDERQAELDFSFRHLITSRGAFKRFETNTCECACYARASNFLRDYEQNMQRDCDILSPIYHQCIGNQREQTMS